MSGRTRAVSGPSDPSAGLGETERQALDLYSAALVNTRRRCRGKRPRTPETGRNGRDTRLLYALYSVVFRCRMHTKSASQPYSRKGFQFCIQCIQRIPTPFVFGFSLLLGREYMNTVNMIAGLIRVPVVRPATHRRRPIGPLRRPWRNRAAGTGFVFSGPREYMRRPVPIGVVNAGNGTKRPRHAPVVCIVFSCIQMPNAYKISPLALLP